MSRGTPSIMNEGWDFNVLTDAQACPLVSLGLAYRYLRAAINSGATKGGPP